MSDMDDIGAQWQKAERDDTLTWWNAPDFLAAKRRLLDLFELVPSIKQESGRREWWRIVAALGDARNRAGEMDSDELQQLMHNPPPSADEAVERLASAVVPVLEDRTYGRHMRHALREGAGERFASRERVEDDRIAAVAESLLQMLSSEPFPTLIIQLGHANEPGIPSRAFGRMWLDDATSSAWTVVRSFHSDVARWGRY
ncbi:hypothetical protein [Pseudonocardia acaciae]|uniref:hypothetical protein n=1 Tax=Pseudonocardia acaciae TaxID=551276 RepID=UPI0012EDB577|nr:hypothetical protein [Pseudonocardia acaciae]